MMSAAAGEFIVVLSRVVVRDVVTNDWSIARELPSPTTNYSAILRPPRVAAVLF